MSTEVSPRQPALVLWMIWLMLLGGMVVMSVLLWESGPAESGRALPLRMLTTLGAGMFFAATLVRWVVLPRAPRGSQAMLSMALVGMALGEGCLIFGLLLAGSAEPLARVVLMALGVVGVLQFAPVYAGGGSGPRDFTKPELRR